LVAPLFREDFALAENRIWLIVSGGRRRVLKIVHKCRLVAMRVSASFFRRSCP
jgi:hypothetical protein